jgi:hypothetical protein
MVHDDYPGHVEATMRSTSAATVGGGRRTQQGRDPAEEPLAPRPATDPASKDDGSVPEKQINRWVGEGGSWKP